FEDTVDASLEVSARQAKRSINTDGYESDSTDDGECVVMSRRSGANEMGDEDDDMFAPSGSAGKEGTKNEAADDDDDDDEEYGGGSKKEKVLELGDIEGQEFGEAGGGQSDNEDDDDEPVDEDEAERRAKKGMGFELTGFNMKEEMEEGKFVDDGTFVRSRDPHEMHDRWLEGTSERDMKRARKAHEKREKEEREREAREMREQQRKGKEEYELELVQLMRRGESVMETLQRLGAEAKKAGGQKHKAKRKPAGIAAASMDIDGDTEPSTTPIERVTALASTLMELGNMDVYDDTYEQLLRSVRRSGLVSQNWVPPSQTPPRKASPPLDNTQYEYRWSPDYLAVAGGSVEGPQTFGPFQKRDLDAWRSAGYFGGYENCERVQVRGVGDSEWKSWNAVF
ncbi:hypothetical protein DACRYDRAFT_28794, partial [Dacryopinax primogenitus]